MEFKWIYGNDLAILDSVVAEKGWTPIPKSSMALIAVDKDGLAGFHVLRVVSHPEPLWVRFDKRGTGLAAELADGMSKFLEETGTEGFMCVADSPEAVKLCESLGMRLVTNPVYIK